MSNARLHLARLVAVGAVAFIAAGPVSAAGWGMMGDQGSSMMGDGMGPGMMQRYGGFGHANRQGAEGSGRAIFAGACASCHDIRQGTRGGDGPNLHDVFGRRAGSLPGYDYSRAMRRSGVVWNMASLTRFIANPSRYIPGNRMPFSGLPDSDERRELLSYLRSATR